MGYLQSGAKLRTQRAGTAKNGGKLLPVIRNVAQIRSREEGGQGRQEQEVGVSGVGDGVTPWVS